MTNLSLILYGGKEYLTRDATLADGTMVQIADKRLEDALMINGEEYSSPTARLIDEQFYAYIDEYDDIDMLHANQNEFNKYVQGNFE